MPCTGGGPAPEDEDRMLRAYICALSQAVGKTDTQFLEAIAEAPVDWNECGILRQQLVSWVLKHRRDDARRREQDSRLARENEVREKAELERLQKKYEK